MVPPKKTCFGGFSPNKKIEVIRKIDPFHKPLFSHVKNIIAVVSNEKIDTDLPVFKDK